MFCLNSFGKLGAIVRSAFADPDAVIKALFASGEQGAWYAPRDLTTMFQDRAGTTPVTADGQTVGLILDKSKGLVLGPELVTNGTFDSDAGWTKGTGWTISGGKASHDAISGYTLLVASTSPILQYKWYTWEFDVTYAEAGSQVGINVCGNIESWATTVGHYKGVVYTLGVGLSMDALGSGAISVDNISIKELAGNHATAPSGAARPLKTSTGLSDWINYDAVDDVLNSTFPSSLGSSCTVCRANVGAAPTILTAQTIGTSYADSTDHAGLIIINRALTGQETTDVTAWLTAKGATA